MLNGLTSFGEILIRPLFPQGRNVENFPSFSAASVGAVATKLGAEVCPINGNTADSLTPPDTVTQ